MTLGSLQFIDAMFVEFHTFKATTEEKKQTFRDMKDIIMKIGQVSEYLTGKRKMITHKLKFLLLDDETYFKSNFSLPKCEKK